MSEVQILESVQQFMARQHGHFIDGKLVAAELLDKVDIVNPSIEQVVAQISIGSQHDVENAVKSAEHAFKMLGLKTTPYERGVKLNKLADLIEQHGEELAQLETLSTGKLINISRHLEVAQSVIFLRYFAGGQPKLMVKPCNPLSFFYAR